MPVLHAKRGKLKGTVEHLLLSVSTAETVAPICTSLDICRCCAVVSEGKWTASDNPAGEIRTEQALDQGRARKKQIAERGMPWLVVCCVWVLYVQLVP